MRSPIKKVQASRPLPRGGFFAVTERSIDRLFDFAQDRKEPWLPTPVQALATDLGSAEQTSRCRAFLAQDSQTARMERQRGNAARLFLALSRGYTPWSPLWRQAERAYRVCFVILNNVRPWDFAFRDTRRTSTGDDRCVHGAAKARFNRGE
ncbi:hypothetical protein KM043_008727 [Ampulex compressa]|nr:hypothetical protein KM043_008727 [Ampulex compressa]